MVEIKKMSGVCHSGWWAALMWRDMFVCCRTGWPNNENSRFDRVGGMILHVRECMQWGIWAKWGFLDVDCDESGWVKSIHLLINMKEWSLLSMIFSSCFVEMSKNVPSKWSHWNAEFRIFKNHPCASRDSNPQPVRVSHAYCHYATTSPCPLGFQGL